MSGTLALLVALMAAEILRSRKIHTDDTSVPVIVPGETKTKKGYFWAYCGDDQHRYSVYDFTLSHCRDGPARWLRGYCGYLQADAYGGYDGIAIQSDGRLKLVGCGAHLRRRFFAQRTLAPEVACAALAWFRQLYQWERRWKDLAEEDRYAQRQQHAVLLLGQFHDWLVKTEPQMLPPIVHDRRLLPLLKETSRTAPLTEEQRARLLGCQRPSHYLDLLRCHTRSLAEVFLRNQMDQDIIAALSELLPDRWIAAHPQYRLEINRSTGTPVGLEAALSGAEC